MYCRNTEQVQLSIKAATCILDRDIRMRVPPELPIAIFKNQ